METNLTAKKVEENANKMRLMIILVMKEWKNAHKTKQIPILPTHRWEDGGYSQS